MKSCTRGTPRSLPTGPSVPNNGNTASISALFSRLWRSRWRGVWLVLMVSVAVSVVLARFTPAPVLSEKSPTTLPMRIVSLSPSITETLFALGLGERVIAVTRYCEYPPEVAGKLRLGTMNELSLESLLALQPDLVVVLEGYEAVTRFLNEQHIPTLTVQHSTMQGVLASFAEMGKVCGVPETGILLERETRAALLRVQQAVQGRPPVSAIISALRDQGTGGLANIYIAGKDGLYSELLTLAGASNAYQGDLVFPAVSVESLRLLAPEVVIELTPTGFSMDSARQDWNSEPNIPAVRTGRVHMLGTFAVVPGPRLVQTLTALARLFHPGVLP